MCINSSFSEFNDMNKILKTRIQLNGPITVADYMRYVLTNSVSGYYMNKDVFGTEGDFITSPEISQLFGEMIGIWCLNEWMQAGSPNNFQIIELGPGRGTLTHDILRSLNNFKDVIDNVSVHLIEISPKMKELQVAKLCSESYKLKKEGHDKMKHVSDFGPTINWHQNIDDIPEGYACFIAHEFFDALPIHKFVKKDNKWHEMFIDIDCENPGKFKYVLSLGETNASKLLVSNALSSNDSRDHIECSPDGGIFIQKISQHIFDHGGAALIIDYGHSGEKTDTFRSFCNHELHDALANPGTADLTADVDFQYLKKLISCDVSSHGPITQGEFLFNMGIRYRLAALLQKAPKEMRPSLISGYEMITDKKKGMSERFKCLAILNKNDDYIPAGFKSL